MKFERLSVYANYDGEFKGTLSISEKAGKIELNLNSEQVEKIITLCAESIVDVAESAANDMRDQVLESLKNSKRSRTS